MLLVFATFSRHTSIKKLKRFQPFTLMRPAIVIRDHSVRCVMIYGEQGSLETYTLYGGLGCHECR